MANVPRPWHLPPQFRRQFLHRLLERGVRMTARQNIHQVFPQRRIYSVAIKSLRINGFRFKPKDSKIRVYICECTEFIAN